MQSQCNHTSKGRQVPRRGCLAFGESQRNEILSLLRQAGPAVVPSAFLIFEKHFTQCGTRVFELQKMGYEIHPEDREGRYPTWYVLASRLARNQIPDGADWYERGHGYRPAQTTRLPLFDSAVQE